MTIDGMLEAHCSNYRRGRTGKVRYIVLHYTANNGDTAMGNCVYFSSAGKGASAHYFCDENSIMQSVREEDTAWHCGSRRAYRHEECRNGNSIGIEMCSRIGAGGEYYLMPETVRRAAALTRDLMSRYGIDAAHVLRHHDVTGKICPAPWVHDERQWQSFLNCITTETEDNMTRDERYAEFLEFENRANPLYRNTEDVPEYWREDVEALVTSGAIKGDGHMTVGKRRSELAAIIVCKRYTDAVSAAPGI